MFDENYLHFTFRYFEMIFSEIAKKFFQKKKKFKRNKRYKYLNIQIPTHT